MKKHHYAVQITKTGDEQNRKERILEACLLSGSRFLHFVSSVETNF